MLVHADVPCCAVKSCPLVNDCNLLAGFFDFYLPLSNLTPSMRGFSQAIEFMSGIRKLEWLIYNPVKVA